MRSLAKLPEIAKLLVALKVWRFSACRGVQFPKLDVRGSNPPRPLRLTTILSLGCTRFPKNGVAVLAPGAAHAPDPFAE
jgi:hypothetical protein